MVLHLFLFPLDRRIMPDHARQLGRKSSMALLPPPTSGPLEIERPSAEPVVQPPSKGVLRKSSYNPNARDAQHYNIVEDLA